MKARIWRSANSAFEFCIQYTVCKLGDSGLSVKPPSPRLKRTSGEAANRPLNKNIRGAILVIAEAGRGSPAGPTLPRPLSRNFEGKSPAQLRNRTMFNMLGNTITATPSGVPGTSAMEEA